MTPNDTVLCSRMSALFSRHQGSSPAAVGTETTARHSAEWESITTQSQWDASTKTLSSGLREP